MTETSNFQSQNAKKRCIVLTILLPESILKMDASELDSVIELKKAIIAFVGKLKPNDYVCFNIGNNSRKMQNDKQNQLKTWQVVIQENKEYLKLINKRDSFRVAISYAREVSGEASTNLIVVNNTEALETQRRRVLFGKIFITSLWVMLHSYILFYVVTFKAGHCYAPENGSMVPLFDNPFTV